MPAASTAIAADPAPHVIPLPRTNMCLLGGKSVRYVSAPVRQFLLQYCQQVREIQIGNDTAAKCLSA
jgi:hypothetical protein